MTTITANLPGFNDVQQASTRIARHIHTTPVLTSRFLNEISSATLYFKCENFQKTGSFKARGACNAVATLTDHERRRGVTTHSSGNHGAALAYAASQFGCNATVVMPRTALQSKKDAVQSYGAKLVECDPTNSAREETCLNVAEKSGATFVHPYNDASVIAGQGTCALELLGEINHLDDIVTPIGGGGLISGTVLSAQALFPDTQVIAVAPVNADDAARSIEAGKIIADESPDTVADGLKVPLKALTWHFVSGRVHDVLTVSEAEIICAMRLIWQRLKIVIEPSSAVTLAAVVKNPQVFSGRQVGLILTGGNVNLDSLPWQM